MKDMSFLVFRVGTLALLFGLAGLFAFSATRGLDMSDEGYYLLNFLYWREFKAIFSMFGAYLSIPFLVFGKSIVAVRLFGFFLVVASSLFFGLAFFRLMAQRVAERKIEVLFPALILACCAVNYFGPFRTLVTPSYNTLALSCMLISTGLLFQLASSGKANTYRWIAMGYGLVISVCLLDKFSTAIVLAAWHLAMAWALRSELRGKLGVRLAAYAAAGFMVNQIALFTAAPDLLNKLLRGLQFQSILLPRDIPAEMQTMFLSDIPRSLLGALVHLAPVAVPVLVIGYVTRMRHAVLFDVSIVALVAFVVSYPNFQNYPARNSELGLMALLLWVVGRYCVADGRNRFNYKNGLVLILVAGMPFAYSIGTNVPILLHMALAIVFPFSVCIVQLCLLKESGRIREWTYYVCLLVLGSTALVPLLRPWVHKAYTYQLGTSLGEQIVATPMADQSSSLRLDARSSKAVGQYREILRQAGFKRGMPMIDFTSMPTLAFLAGGVPVATPCLFATFPARTEGAQWVLRQVDGSELRGAWLITSDDYIGRLDAQKIVASVIGDFPFQPVGEFVLPYANQIYGPQPKRETQDVTIRIWRPVSGR